MRKLDVLNLSVIDQPQPRMPDACSSGGCGGPDTPPEPVEIGGAVRVAGEEIDPQAIAREMQNHPASSPDEAWLAAARALTVKALLVRAAGADGEDESAIQAHLEAEVEGHPPSAEECRRVYDAAPSRFASPELIEAAHILIEPEEDTPGAWRRAEIVAEKLIADIAGDERRFVGHARTKSGCPSSRQDGSLGQVRRGELAWPVERALLALKDGEISSRPVQSKHGWHILRVHRRIAGRQLPYELVEGRIRDMLEARSWAMAAAHYVGTLATRFGVEGISLREAA